MKIKELFNEYGSHYGLHHDIKKTIKRYWDDDVVIAYHKSSMGMIAILKGKRRLFSFMFITNKLNSYVYAWINGKQIDEQTAFELIKDDGKILNKEEWNKLGRRFILSKL